MKNILTIFILLTLFSSKLYSQQCMGGGCTSASFTNQYPSGTFSTTSSSWSVVNGSNAMNAGNYTDFSVTIGNTYEWSYCENYGGVSTAWDAQLTLFNKANLSTPLCYSTDACGTNGLAPYISWPATFTGTVRLLSTSYINGNGGCKTNSGSPYNKLVWRQSSGACTPPSKPTGLTATPVSSSQINLSWNAVAGAIGYDVSYCDGTYIGYVTGTSYSHTGRVENTTYSYKVQAQKSSTCVSGFTSCSSATTPPSCTPPSKPTGLTATPVSSSQINLSWNAVAGAIGYDVSYCDGTYIGYVTGTSYSHTGRVENTTYSYKVQAQKSSTCVSGFTSCSSATTPPSCTPPSKPTGLTATPVSSSQINLSWNAVAGAIGYDVSYCDGTYIGYVTGTSYSHTGRVENTTYSYKVQAQKSSTCVSGFTSCSSATTPPSCTPPSKPTGLTATPVSSSQINLSWNAVAGAIGYDVSYCDGTYIGYVTGTSYSHTGRVENTTYSYKVQAQKSSTCVSGFTSCSSATTPPSCTPPSKPTGLTATPVSSSQINLSWNAVAGAIGYDVSYCDGTYIGYVTGTSYSHTGRVENTTYSYKVQAQKSSTCVSGFTSCSSATTPPSCTPPSKPTGLTATPVSSSQINLSWNAVAGAIGYDVSYCDGTYIGYVTGTSYPHTGRVENTTYSYKVQAQKSSTCVSGFTSCSSATTPPSCTPPSKPTGLTATPVSSSQINLSWNAVAGAIGYDVSYCDGTYIGYVTGTSYSHTGRVENTTYSYKVQAQKSSTCVSGFTSCSSATTPPSCTPPSVPTGLTATASFLFSNQSELERSRRSNRIRCFLL
jgi:chitodextrinase